MEPRNANAEKDATGTVLLPDQDGGTVRFDLWPRRERRRLPEGVRDREALASLLEGTADQPEATAVALLAWFGSLSATLCASEDQLAAVPSVTGRVAHLLRATHHVTCLALRERITRRPLDSQKALERWLRHSLAAQQKECLVGLFLDRRNGLIRDEILATGTVDQVPLYAREVVIKALRLGASAVVLVHNHPSGDATPSSADIEETRRVAGALGTVGVVLHDHIIVGHDRSVSMRAEEYL
jgi:DNA repair protein RadC